MISLSWFNGWWCMAYFNGRRTVFECVGHSYLMVTHQNALTQCDFCPVLWMSSLFDSVLTFFLSDLCGWHCQAGSLAGAAHLFNDNAGVQSWAQREHKSHVDQKSSLDFDFKYEYKLWRIDRMISLSWFNGWWCMAYFNGRRTVFECVGHSYLMVTHQNALTQCDFCPVLWMSSLFDSVLTFFLSDLCGWHCQAGSLAGAAHLFNDNAGVQSWAQREHKSHVDQKSSLDFDFKYEYKRWRLNRRVFVYKCFLSARNVCMQCSFL